MDPESAGASRRHEEGLVAMLLDATAGYREELTEERILGWHSWLFPSGIHRDQPVRAGEWRTGPARVISGLLARERVLPGPEPEQVPGEMRDFLEWFNSPPETDGVLRAATAQLWFSTVHPFEDSNGLFARAITGMALAQSQNSPMRLYSMSHQILQERNTYSRDLEKATLETTGGYDTTTWLSRFARCFGQAMDDALETLSAAQHNTALMEQTRPAAPQPQAAPGAGDHDQVHPGRDGDRHGRHGAGHAPGETAPGERHPPAPDSTRPVTAKATGTQGHRTSPPLT